MVASGVQKPTTALVYGPSAAGTLRRDAADALRRESAKIETRGGFGDALWQRRARGRAGWPDARPRRPAPGGRHGGVRVKVALFSPLVNVEGARHLASPLTEEVLSDLDWHVELGG